MPNFYSRHSDFFLWLCLTTVGAVLALNARKNLFAVREATRVTKEEKHDEIISQSTEDAVKLETLGELLESPSYEIRQAAIKIITERAVRPDNYDLLISNINSKSSTLQSQALHSLRFLTHSTPQDLDLSTRTLSALIGFLASRLPAVRTRPHEPTDWRTRPQAERDALVILTPSLHTNLAPALAAGLVSRWLAHYPFGGTSVAAGARQELVNKIAVGQTDDALMGSVLSAVVYEPAGRKALRQAGLYKGSFEEAEERGWGLVEVALTHLGAAAGGGDGAGEGVGRVERVREESPEEAALRRRRRMAMVINDGGPLGSDNIIDVNEDFGVREI